MRFIERLDEIKEDLRSGSQERLVFLMDKKNLRVMEGLVAWRNLNIDFDPDFEVDEDADIEDLWRLVSFSNKEYAICLGVGVGQSLPRFRQLKQMNMIFPDGSIDDMCHKLMMTYLKSEIGKILNID